MKGTIDAEKGLNDFLSKEALKRMAKELIGKPIRDEKGHIMGELVEIELKEDKVLYTFEFKEE